MINSPSATQNNRESMTRASIKYRRPELGSKLPANREVMAVVTASYCSSSEADLKYTSSFACYPLIEVTVLLLRMGGLYSVFGAVTSHGGWFRHRHSVRHSVEFPSIVFPFTAGARVYVV